MYGPYCSCKREDKLQLVAMVESRKFDEFKGFLSDVSGFLQDVLNSAEYENISQDAAGLTLTESLHFRCKKLLTYFDNADSKFDENGRESSYLDMTGGKKCFLGPSNEVCVATARNPGDYIIMHGSIVPPELSKDWNKNSLTDAGQVPICRAPQEQTLAVSRCPYANLSVSQLANKIPQRQGQLLRVGIRVLFGHPKKYFAGVLNDWLLCYEDQIAAEKPSVSLHLAVSVIRRCTEENMPQHCFEVSDVLKKRYIFQSRSAEDADAWVSVMCVAKTRTNSDTNDKPVNFENNLAVALTSWLRDNQAKTVRRLPTPPVSKGIRFEEAVFDSSDEEIYEKPCSVLTIQRNGDNDTHYSETAAGPSFVLETKADHSIYQGYDVPRIISPTAANSSSKPIEQHQAHEPVQTQTPDTIDKSLSTHSLISDEAEVEIPRCLKEADDTIILKNEEISLLNSELIEPQIQCQSPSKSKNWFRRKFCKGNNVTWSLIRKRSPMDNRSQCKETPSDDTNCNENASLQNRILVASAKGENLNRIVNRLVDSNGGLPIFRYKDPNTFLAAGSVDE